MKPNEEAFLDFANNPQYILDINRPKNEKTFLFISLGQEDGILISKN